MAIEGGEAHLVAQMYGGGEERGSIALHGGGSGFGI